MLEDALELLKYINSKGFNAYIVGGFVRDYLLGIESTDIDITTDATPQELSQIFEDITVNNDYGSIIVNYNNKRYEITTFRRESNYQDKRHPNKITYIKDLKEDLLRRDFTINAICIDRDNTIIDYYHGREDLDNKIINTIGDAKERFNEDAIRIIRAIRFAAKLDFSISKEVDNAIKEKKYLVKELSGFRKKQELEKIFINNNREKGIKLLLQYGLEEELGIPMLGTLNHMDDLLGIWAYLNPDYPFTNVEHEAIKNIRKCFMLNNKDPYTLYKYGLYINQVAGSHKGISKCEITKLYNELPIFSRKDINIDGDKISKIINKPPGGYIEDIYKDIEKKILSGKLNNTKEDLAKYVLDNYKNLV